MLRDISKAACNGNKERFADKDSTAEIPFRFFFVPIILDMTVSDRLGKHPLSFQEKMW